ncbi:xyloglucan endotransglucosylase protein 2 [Cryptomeria japonica]|uniref:xyloglucan endotransglucosylase protein 2 n=1 Tax=Cryptomeria japonica TaxID=3369 RepID=UPI0027D9EBA5|nr:xyloglucan endotransglucosylase protein 2 [Cryptomeria japonica]
MMLLNMLPKVFLLFMVVALPTAMAGKPPSPVDVSFSRNYVPTWAFDHIMQIDGGKQVDLVLDKSTGTGFQTKGEYLFGHFSMTIKMVPGDSAGVVTAFYLSSQNSEHDEIDFEFLGNRTGQPYILQTNVFSGGRGDREQRIYLWFDPTKEFHSYSVLWNMNQIVFFVDDVPIRVFKNSHDLGVRYPFNQPMKIYSSLWNADDWATRGGLEKTDWNKAPFVAAYKGFHVDGCEASAPNSQCSTVGMRWWDKKEFDDLDGLQWRKLKEVRQKYTIYNYCTDRVRFPKMAPECARDQDV